MMGSYVLAKAERKANEEWPGAMVKAEFLNLATRAFRFAPTPVEGPRKPWRMSWCKRQPCQEPFRRGNRIGGTYQSSLVDDASVREIIVDTVCAGFRDKE